jgi:elongation factor Ts
MGLDVASIKQLRDRTGAGMSDCKKALEEANGNIDAACDILREKGIIKASKKGSRIAAEGTTLVTANGNKAIILEVNSETDFVGKSDAFKSFVAEVAETLLANEPADLEAAKTLTAELFTNATVKIGEKLDLRRFVIVTKTDDQTFGTYIHMGGKIGVLTVLNGVNAEVAQGLSMHIAANRPLYVSTSDIPAEAIAHETAIQIEAAKTDEKLMNQPADRLEKIIKGKVSKYFAESVFVEQEYLMVPGVKVGQWLKEHGVSVVKMIRFMTGEGLEKREENFAEEVAKQMA